MPSQSVDPLPHLCPPVPPSSPNLKRIPISSSISDSIPSNFSYQKFTTQFLTCAPSSHPHLSLPQGSPDPITPVRTLKALRPDPSHTLEDTLATLCVDGSFFLSGGHIRQILHCQNPPSPSGSYSLLITQSHTHLISLLMLLLLLCSNGCRKSTTNRLP